MITAAAPHALHVVSPSGEHGESSRSDGKGDSWGESGAAATCSAAPLDTQKQPGSSAQNAPPLGLTKRYIQLHFTCDIYQYLRRD